MIHAVIMAGGSGTRFWPLSRKAKPKQFLTIVGGETLLRTTAKRILPVCGWENLMVVVCREQAASVRRNLPELRRANLVVEPRARNTAPAIGLAALAVRERDPHGLMVVLPSDHVVRPVKEFRKLIRAACSEARAGALVTLGIVPVAPETGYGYIQVDRKRSVAGSPEVFRVARFTEKPDRGLAEEYLRDGRFFWNSGMYVFTAESILRSYATHLPALHQLLEEAVAAPRRKRAAFLERAFERIDPISIDYGVMEKATNILMIPCNCFWSDVGSFATLGEVLERDASGNMITGDVVALDSRGCVLRSESRLLACVGLRDTIVIETPDVVMVCPLEDAQRVGRLVEELRSRKKVEVL